jgi:hypothetical protein
VDHEVDPKLQEPIDDEERRLLNPDTWDWDALEELPPSPNPGVVLGVRFSLEEMTRVGEAAAAEGQTIYEFIKEGALLRSREAARR